MVKRALAECGDTNRYLAISQWVRAVYADLNVSPE
jgi:hypothetical protein